MFRLLLFVTQTLRERERERERERRQRGKRGTREREGLKGGKSGRKSQTCWQLVLILDRHPSIHPSGWIESQISLLADPLF